MQKRIVYTNPGGGITVVTPVINTHALDETTGELVVWPEAIREDEAIERAMRKLPADAIDPRIVDASEIPTDRTFRNAWIAAEGKVGYDMDRAREIHKDNLRKLRAPKLAALDVQYMVADEVGDGELKAQVIADKQALRDVTDDPAITKAKTVEELKAILPEALR